MLSTQQLQAEENGWGCQDQEVSGLLFSEVEMDIDLAIPCGLIINELVANAFKYAFSKGEAGTLLITMHPEKDMLELVIKDNGIGMQEGIDLVEK